MYDSVISIRQDAYDILWRRFALRIAHFTLSIGHLLTHEQKSTSKHEKKNNIAHSSGIRKHFCLYAV